MGPLAIRLLRGAALVGVVAVTAAMAWAALRPGSGTWLPFAAVVAGTAWVGGAGVVFDRRALSLAGAGGLLLLGFWQAVLWVVMVPAAAALFAVALVGSGDEPDRPPARADGDA